jgi:hypothetical protein
MDILPLGVNFLSLFRTVSYLPHSNASNTRHNGNSPIPNVIFFLFRGTGFFRSVHIHFGSYKQIDLRLIRLHLVQNGSISEAQCINFLLFESLPLSQLAIALISWPLDVKCFHRCIDEKLFGLIYFLLLFCLHFFSFLNFLFFSFRSPYGF